ncbi:MAG: carbohydrate ABC transporter permease [Defluviitaleaceae bacterium]|nr:carbohydrate ABC transporter permease [Defluviitaleaceae bacterium]
MKKNKNKEQNKMPRKSIQWEPIIFHTINFTLLIGLCIIMIYPMLNQLAIALNDGLDAIRGGIRLWPREFTLENFRAVFATHTIVDAFFMSVYRTVITVILNIIITFMLAYALSRREFVLRKVITIVFVLTMYFDPGLIPHFLLMQSLGMVNTFHIYWVPNLIGAFNLIIMRTYIRGISESYIESARLDGAGEFRICWQVIMPLCKPVIATVALFVAVGSWNAWFDNFIFNAGTQRLAVLQFELMRLLAAATGVGQAGQGHAAQAAAAAAGVAQVTPLTIRAAITVVAAVPILMVYPFLQKYFVSGVQLGGVKE